MTWKTQGSEIGFLHEKGGLEVPADRFPRTVEVILGWKPLWVTFKRSRRTG